MSLARRRKDGVAKAEEGGSKKPSILKKIAAPFAKNKKLIAIPIIIVILLIALFGFVIPRALAPKVSGSTVSEATVQTGTVSVTVTGTGTLASSDDISVDIPNGVVIKKVYVQAGETVEKGQKLASVTKESVALALLNIREELDDIEDELSGLSTSDTSSDDYLQSVVLKGQRTKLQAAEDTLEDLMDSQIIKASKAGTVGTVSVSAGSTVGSAATTESSAGTSSGFTMTSTATKATTALATYVIGSSKTSTTAAAQSAGMSADVAEDGTINSVTVGLDAPVTGATAQTSISGNDAVSAQLSWSPSVDTFKANTAYTATIVIDAADGCTFSDSTAVNVPGATVSQTVTSNDQGRENARLIVSARYDKTTADSSQDVAPSNNADGNSSYDAGSANAGTSNASRSYSSGSFSVSSGSSSVASGSTDSSSTLSVDDYSTAIITMSSGNKVCVSISVDEADITSVSVDQNATVTVDAAGSDSFEGKVVEVTTSSSSSSGSVKYTAKVQIDKTEDMMLGMSASAVINVKESSADALTIPVAALQESGNRTFVYTSSDGNGNLSGEVDVTTGVSDGTTVEITEGLTEGQTVYYTKSAGDSSSDSFSFGNMGSMPGGGSFDPSSMPSMGGSSSSSGDRPTPPSGGFGGKTSSYATGDNTASTSAELA